MTYKYNPPSAPPSMSRGDFATNLRCAYLNIRDMRLAEARGSLESMRETLTALPAGDHWGVLGLRRGASEPEIREAYRLLAQKHHPDHGGDPELMARLNAARDKALAEMGA